ncbi:MAG: hypothetical protein ABI910_06870 [Gemmatimonadota bacterium]
MPLNRLPMVGRGRWLAALLVLSTGACDALTGPRFPTDAVRFEPLPVYAEWWRVVESCAGVRGDLSAISWYQAPRATIVESLGQQADAYWTGNGNRILISFDRLGDGQLVRHEMLHALLRVGGHARAHFMQRCAGVVACRGECLLQAGNAPVASPSARRVPPESLEVWSEVTPSAPGSATWGGFLMLTVQARNPYDEPVVLLLPPSGDAGEPASFSFTAVSRSSWMRYDARADDGGVLLFAPHERKQMVFDFSLGPRLAPFHLDPGDWVMRGSYGEHQGAAVAVTIAP